MTFKHDCPHCRARLRLDDDEHGRLVDCPQCQREFRAPDSPVSVTHRNGVLLVAALIGGGLLVFTSLIVVVCLLAFRVADAPEEVNNEPEKVVEVPPPQNAIPEPEPKPKPKAPPPASKAEPNPRIATDPPLVLVQPGLPDAPPPKKPPQPKNTFPEFQPPPPPPRPRRIDEPEIAPKKAKLAFPPVNSIALKPAPLSEDRVELKLPGKVTETCVGGGGRYWILKIPDSKQLAIFDANLAKIAKYLPLASGNVRFAAGMNKLVLVYPDTELIARYNLETFEKETTAQLPFKGVVKSVAMGSACGGPLLVHYGKGAGALDPAPIAMVDLATFKELELGNEGFRAGMGGFPRFRDQMQFRVSPDGRVYGSWSTGVSPSGLSSVVLGESGARSRYAHDSVGSVVPMEDGTLLTSSGKYTPELKAMGKREPGERVPAQQGNWYLKIIYANTTGLPNREPGPIKLLVHMLGDDRSLFSLTEQNVLNNPFGGDLTIDKRILFSPAGGLIAILVGNNDKLVLNRFDLQDSLEKSGVDYLFVSSRPPVAEPGKAFRYPIDVKAKKGGVKLKIDAGPEGMKVDGTAIVWNVPEKWSGAESVIVTVSDAAGQEIFHSFSLAPAGAADPKGPDLAPPRFVRPDPDPPLAPKASAGGIVRPPAKTMPITPTRAANRAEVKLPGTVDATCFAGGGRFVLLRLPKTRQVAVLDVSEGKIVRYIPLPEDNAFVAGGMSHAYVLAPTANVIQRWSLTTFEKELTIANPLNGAVRQLLMGHASDGPLFVGGPNRMLDGKTLKEVALPGAFAGGINHPQYPWTARVSADGRVYGWWTPGLSPAGLSSMVIGENGAKSYSQHTSVGAIHPGPDGTLFTGCGLFTSEGKPLGEKKAYQYWSASPIPAAHGKFYIDVGSTEIPRPDIKPRQKVSLKMLRESTTLADLGTPAGMDSPAVDLFGRVESGSTLSLNERVFFVPDAKTLVALNATQDKLSFNSMDIEEQLSKSGVKYLFVTSRPSGAERGTTFKYAPVVKSKAGGVKLKLDAGPDGMVVEGDKVVWKVPADFAASDASVILTVSDSGGQEVFHTFTLPITTK